MFVISFALFEVAAFVISFAVFEVAALARIEPSLLASGVIRSIRPQEKPPIPLPFCWISPPLKSILNVDNLFWLGLDVDNLVQRLLRDIDMTG